MITSTRQGIFILFILTLVFLGKLILEMSFFEIFLIICLAGIILKLTDIQETIVERG